MADKTWNIDFQGHSIQAINRLSWFPPRTSEALEIDGVKVIDAPGSLLRTTATHFTRHVLDGAERTVEMRFANEKGAFKVGCEVWVDGCKVGGTKAIMYPDLEETRRTLAKGFLRYFFTYGLPRFGLPYAIFMLLMLRPSTTASAVGTFAFHTIFFGGLMSWFLWRSLVDSARVRARFAAGHEKS